MNPAARKLSAILFTDIVGYAALMGEDEHRGLRIRQRHDALVRDFVGRFRGDYHEERGDESLSTFPSALEAVNCALAMQASLVDDLELKLRIGIHLGDVLFEDSRVYGDGVNLAARIRALAEPGGICASGEVCDAVRNHAHIVATSLGKHHLKNVTRPVLVYRICGGPSVNARKEPAESFRGDRRNRAFLTEWVPNLPRKAFVALAIVFFFATVAAILGLPALQAARKNGLPITLLPDRPSIAVLPFVNLSGDPEQQYFSDGMTQDLIADLSKISGLFVIAHNSVLEYRARPVNLENVSRELGVRYVVDGSTRRASDHVRIAAELLDTKTGRALWSDRYDRDVKDIFSVQDEITRKIAADLNVEVKEAEFKRVRRIPTENLSAYDSFLRGTDLWRRVTPESTREAQRMFERAVELDPKFAAAYAYLGFIKLREMELFWSLGAPAAIRALADKALSADDSDPMAHILSAYWLQGEGKLDRAEAEVRRAIALDPNSADIRARAADILNYRKPNEAIVELEQAMRLNPRYPPVYLAILGVAYGKLGRYQDAIDAHKKALVGDPNLIWSRFELAMIYRALGREDEAGTEEEEARRLSPNRHADILVTDAPAKMPTGADARDDEQVRSLLRGPGEVAQ